MSKSLNKKETRKQIISKREEGFSDQEIYNEIAPNYYDKKSVALLIMSTVKKENIKKYNTYNEILRILIAITIIVKIFTVISLALSSDMLLAMLLVFIVPIFNLYFLYVVSTYSAALYKSCGILAIASIFQSFGHMENLNPLDFVTTLILLGGIAGLFFYLFGKLIPDYDLTKFQKDKNGDYILNDNNSPSYTCKICDKITIVRDESVTKCQWCNMTFDYVEK